MRPADSIRGFNNTAAVSTNPKMDKVVLDAVLTAHEETMNRASAAIRPSMRSIVMTSPITRIAAVAMIVVAIVLVVGLWDRSAPSAYAIEQTMEANRSVRYLHIRNFTAGHEEPREGWVEFGEDGQARNLRAQVPEWASPVDGARVIVWKDGAMQMWLKKQNRLAITKADNVQGQMNDMLQELDPRQAIARISEPKEQGKVEVTVEEPSDTAKPITMTVTYLSDSPSPGRRKVLSIDPGTKLISTIELYQLKDGEYRYEGKIELQEYNQPIDARMFDLTTEVPSGTTRLDFGATDIGLTQGQLSDEDVAVEVVRQFLQSLIGGDYETAGRLLPVGADRLKQQFGSVRFLRIVSIGPAIRSPGPAKEVTVPCTIEIEESGRKNSVTFTGVTVHPLGAQPSRWTIRDLGN